MSSTTDTIRVVIADDHSIMRDGLQRLLEDTDEFTVVGQAANGKEALRSAEKLHPDIIIMDVLMPLMDGIESCARITTKLPDTHILMLTAVHDDETLLRSLSAGATGYLHKYAGKDELISTVRDVAAGELRVPAASARKILSRLRPPGQQQVSEQVRSVTEREKEILALFARGASLPDIAKRMGNSPHTIRNNIYAIQKRLDIKTKPQLAVWAVQHGLLDEF